MEGTTGLRLCAARVGAWDRARPVRRVPEGARVARGVLRRVRARECRCAVCLDALQRATAVGACLHRFCRRCIEDALRRSRSACPACNAPVPSHRALRDDTRFQRIVDFLSHAAPDNATSDGDEEGDEETPSPSPNTCFACSKEAAAALERQRQAVAAAEAEAQAARRNQEKTMEQEQEQEQQQEQQQQ